MGRGQSSLNVDFLQEGLKKAPSLRSSRGRTTRYCSVSTKGTSSPQEMFYILLLSFDVGNSHIYHLVLVFLLSSKIVFYYL